MKIKKIAALVLFLINSSAFARPSGNGSINQPSVSLDFSSFQLNHVGTLSDKYFEKKLTSRPEYLVNSYLGNFLTSFAIDLPKNDFFKDGLWFDYNSSQTFNYGFGVGFTLRLPKIIYKDKKYFYSSGNANELIEVQNTFNVLSRINLISKALNKTIVVLKVFRLKDDEDFSLFLKLPEGMLQLSLSGESNLFDNRGLLIAKISASQKVLNLTYNDQRLAALSAPNESWSLEINYKENEAQYKYVNGHFYQVPRGINWITVKQNSTNRRYDFTYQNDLLTGVKKDGAIHDVFIANYQVQPGRIIRKPFNGTNVTGKNITFKNFNKIPEFENASADTDKQVLSLDLNGDFITDEVTFDQSESRESLQQKFRAIFADVYKQNCDERCYITLDEQAFSSAKKHYENLLNSQTMNLKVKFGKFVNQVYQLESDASLSLSTSISLWGSFVVTGSNSVSVRFDQARSPRFIDINNDGKKDLVLASIKEEKVFGGESKKQDILVLSAFNLLNRPSEDNIFNYEGETPVAYLLKTDDEKLGKLEVDSKTDIYQLTNVNFWEKIQPQFKMNAYSMLMDYNGDGINDILTGKTIYLMGDNGESRAEKINDQELKNLFNVDHISEDTIYKVRYGLINIGGSGVWESFVASNYYIQPNDRTLHILTDSDEFILERPSDVPLLTSLRSVFGGSLKIDYQYVDGAYAVKKIAHNLSDLDQNSWEEHFSYIGARWHVQKNFFLGFKKGIIEKRLFSNADLSRLNTFDKKEFEFDLDDQNGPLFFLSRARKAGRVISEKHIGENGTEKEINNVYAEHSFANRRTFSYLLSQNIVEKGKSDLKTTSVYSKFLNEIPLIQRIEKNTGRYKYLSVVANDYIDGMYLQRTRLTEVVNSSGHKRMIETNEWNNLGQLIKRETPSLVESFLYDFQGRIIGYKTSNGKIEKYTYVKDLSLIQSVEINDLKTRYEYSDVENEIIKMVFEGSPDRYFFNYSTDGVLTSILKNSSLIFEQKMKDKKIFETSVLDEKFRIKVDGYGRVVSKSQLGDDDNIILFKRSLDDKDRPLLELGPSFENGSASAILTKRHYDLLGNVISEVQFDETNTKLTQNWLTFGACAEKRTTIGFSEILCKNGLNSTESLSIPNEVSTFEYGFVDEVSAIQSFGHTYKRNENGDIIESSSPYWGKFSRHIDYTENSISYDDGQYELTNAFGDLKSFSNGLEGSFNVTISADYGKKLLQSLSLNLGGRKFVHNYFYNPSRALIGKKEFNTVWKYHLDQFDRVETELITDAVNSYSLQYNRKNGIVTGIAPYVTRIEYSPLMKPTLIEYSNGSSSEYNYGPRGELLVFSFTKGTRVIYQAKYDYRSDLKLISQSVITNKHLDEQSIGFSYNDAFEVSRKPERLNNLRDRQGQVKQLNGAEFSYHHLNLTKIVSGNNSVKNFYGKNNHYIGSCNGAEQCFYKLSTSEVEYNGEIQKLVEVRGVPVGLLYKGNFYPAIIDHKLAVVGLANEQGANLQFLRSFDEWGNILKVSGDRNFEKDIAFSFSKLLQNPIIEKSSMAKLYFSGTRVYSPGQGEWMSPDSTVIWNPEKLVSMAGNWDPFRYANNDPVNYLDVNGNWIHIAIGGVLGGVAGGITASATKSDVFGGIMVGGITGASLASGAGLVTNISSFAAQSSVVSTFTFTGNLLAQAIFTKSIDMMEAASVAILAPISFAYSKLFASVGSEMLRESASGMSFMSVDIGASFASSALKKRMETFSDKNYSMGNYNLNTSFGK